MTFPAAAQQILPLRVDCGDNNGFPAGEPGWLQLTQTSGPPGISLAPAALDTVHIAGNLPFLGVAFPSDVMTIDPDELGQTHRLTALQLQDQTVLSISGLAGSGLYRVRLELGAGSPWYDMVGFTPTGYLTISRRVQVETQVPGGPLAWRVAAREVRCTAGYTGNTLASFVGATVPVWVIAQADAAGVLRLRLSTAGTDPVFLTGFEVHAHESLPVFYKRTGAGSLQFTAPELAAFVAAFHARDFATAEALALALSDPWLRGVALVTLIGWLDGSRDGLVHLIPAAQSALTAASTQHPGAAWLLDQLATYSRALAHLDARGYTKAQFCPEQGGTGFINPACKGQTIAAFGQATSNVNAHFALRLLSGLTVPVNGTPLNGTTVLDDLVAWNQGTLGGSAFEPSPLVFAALKLSGVTIPAINPLLSVHAGDAESAEFRQRFTDIFNGFVNKGFAAADFPQDLELPLFHAYATHPLGHPRNWPAADVTGLFTPAQIAASWWGPEVALPPADPVAPLWAQRQREVERLMRAATRYWLTERWRDGEMGGGWGDDVELMVQLMQPFAARQAQADRVLIDRLEGAVHFGLHDYPLVSDGYYSGPVTDVQHSAELTTNPWLTLRGLYGHTATALQAGFDVTRHLVNAAEPATSFAAPTAIGRLHFRNYHFSGNGASTNPATAFDIPLNGRAVLPGILSGFRTPLDSAHPLHADLRAWAAGWRDDALDTSGLANGKPAGFLAPAQWPGNGIGAGATWWNITGSAADKSMFTTSEFSYILELLRVAYHNSTAPDRWQFLLPGVRMFRAVKDWEDAGKPASPPVGGALWAGQQFKAGPRFGSIAFAWRHDLASEPTLNSTLDAYYSDLTTYVDAALVARLVAWTETEFNNQGNSLVYALAPVQPCAPHSIKSSALLLDAYAATRDFIRAFYPLLTTHVLHTDRVFLNQGHGNAQRLAGHTGALFTEGLRYAPLVSWSSRLGDSPELAIQNNLRDAAGTQWSGFVHHFGAQPLAVQLRLEEGLQPGAYLVESGAASEGCDTFPAGGATTSVTVQKRGAGASTSLTLNPGLSLVRVIRQGPADLVPQRWDLAADPPRMELVKGPGQAPTLRITAPVANVGTDASPATTLRLHAGLIGPGGGLFLLPGFAPEVVVASAGVPSLPGSSDYAIARHEVVLSLPLTQLLAHLLLMGMGLQWRVEVVGTPSEHDPLNNDLTRGWTLADMTVVTEF